MEIVENKINPKNVKSEEGILEGEGQTGESSVKQQPSYDPSKKYRWEPGSNFLLSGEEFGVILNSLRAILNTPEAQRILLANKANEAIENSLSRAVQIGIVKEDIKK